MVKVEMTVWWLAIDRANGNASYEELKKRGVIAQGWPDLGDLQADGRLAQLKNAPEQQQAELLQSWLQSAYPDVKFDTRIGNLVKFFCRIRPGDFIIGRPGRRVSGICEIPTYPVYSFDETYNYAHGVGPVIWHDWSDVSPDWAPNPPVPLHAVCRVGEGHNHVESLFRAFLQQKGRLYAMDEWVELLNQQHQIILTGPPGTGLFNAAGSAVLSPLRHTFDAK